uniref:Uncharacterized protein n=1 Tax=Hyaloperonospora arabidopsidis (strain Emoy2) TaxID=559515 RepID=M4BR46_HYAAE
MWGLDLILQFNTASINQLGDQKSGPGHPNQPPTSLKYKPKSNPKLSLLEQNKSLSSASLLPSHGMRRTHSIFRLS